jgi:hypothetical protein
MHYSYINMEILFLSQSMFILSFSHPMICTPLMMTTNQSKERRERGRKGWRERERERENGRKESKRKKERERMKR